MAIFRLTVSAEIVTENATLASHVSLIVELIDELIQFYSLAECAVHIINDDSELTTFWTELSGFLREFGCDYVRLMEGSLQERFQAFNNKLLLIYFLLSELQTARLLGSTSNRSLAPLTAAARQRNDDYSSSSSKKVTTSIMNESNVASHLRRACQALQTGKPPVNVTCQQLFSNLGAKTKAAIDSSPPNQISEPVLKSIKLSPSHWSLIERLIQSLDKEYQTRRETLLKRFDCTVQSFMWSDKGKVKRDAILNLYRPIRQSISESASIGIPQLLAARKDPLLILHKTSSGSAREASKCDLNKIKMGKVPDRGGRAWELEPPPPEMPAFQKRDNSAPQRGGGRGGRPHSGRGDYHQQRHDDRKSSNQNRGGGGNASYNNPQYEQQSGLHFTNQQGHHGNGIDFQYQNSNHAGGRGGYSGYQGRSRQY